MLHQLEMIGSSAVVWMPDGKSFKINDRDLFVKKILPHFFRTNKFRSWQRNLNLWNFTLCAKGKRKGEISHPYFCKGRPDLLQHIVRKKNSAATVAKIEMKENLARENAIVSESDGNASDGASSISLSTRSSGSSEAATSVAGGAPSMTSFSAPAQNDLTNILAMLQQPVGSHHQHPVATATTGNSMAAVPPAAILSALLQGTGGTSAASIPHPLLFTAIPPIQTPQSVQDHATKLQREALLGLLSTLLGSASPSESTTSSMMPAHPGLYQV